MSAKLSKTQKRKIPYYRLHSLRKSFNFCELMENLLYVLLRGFAIGVLISAPMGPIGMLVIQRTLSTRGAGRLFHRCRSQRERSGLLSAHGFRMSFITGFIERNQTLLQLLGKCGSGCFRRLSVSARIPPERSRLRRFRSHTWWKRIWSPASCSRFPIR